MLPKSLRDLFVESQVLQRSTYGIHCILVPAIISLEDLINKRLLCCSKCHCNNKRDNEANKMPDKSKHRRIVTMGSLIFSCLWVLRRRLSDVRLT